MKNGFASIRGLLEGNFQKKSYLVSFSIIILFISLFSRLLLASKVRSPGYGDSTFYYNVAENLVDGRGSQIDWIWNYLYKPGTVTHYAYDYWMPLTTLIISIPMLIWGKSLFVALLPSILIGVTLSIVTYFFAKLYSDSKLVRFCSSALILFLPNLFQYSLVTDCVIYYAFFASLSILFMVKGQEHSEFFLLASFFAGLAYLTKNDGIILLPTLLLYGMLPFLKHKNGNVLILFAALGVFLIVISPLMITNYKIFGQPFPPVASKSLFFTEDNDYFFYSKQFTIRTFLASGLREILSIRLKVAFSYIQEMGDFLGGSSSFVTIFALLGIFQSIFRKDGQDKLLSFLPPLFFMGSLFMFYTFLAPIPGSGGAFERGAMAVIPFLLVIAVEAILRMSLSKSFALASILLVTALAFYQAIHQTNSFIDHWKFTDTEFAKLHGVITTDIKKRGVETNIIIMAEDPWIIYQSTGYKSIMVPNEGNSICDAATKYQVNYLLLPMSAEDQINFETSGCDFLPVMYLPNMGQRLYYVTPNK